MESIQVACLYRIAECRENAATCQESACGGYRAVVIAAGIDFVAQALLYLPVVEEINYC